MHWKNRKTYWHQAVNSALNFLFLKDVSYFIVILLSGFIARCGGIQEKAGSLNSPFQSVPRAEQSVNSADLG